MQINTFDSCWSPDAQQTLFISNKDSFLEGVKIFKINADGMGINKLASNSMDPHTPDWK